METSESIVIIGGGLAGLTAAVHLVERGLKPVVLEADPDFPGGRAAGGKIMTVDGWPFRQEHGVHGIWSPYRNLQAMLSRHAIRPAFVPAQEETWIYKRNGRVKRANVGSALRRSWIPAPLHYLALFIRPRFLGILGLRDWLSLPLVWYSLILAVGIDPLAENQPLDGLYLSDFMRGWSPAIRSFCIGLARNGLSAQPEEVPLSGFIAFLRYYTLLRRDAWGFSYLPGDGGTSLIDPLAAKVLALGGEIRLDTAVTHLSRAGEGWLIHTPDRAFPASQAILAVDPDNARKLLQASPDLSGDVADYYWPMGRETAVIRLWFNRAPTINPARKAACSAANLSSTTTSGCTDCKTNTGPGTKRQVAAPWKFICTARRKSWPNPTRCCWRGLSPTCRPLSLKCAARSFIRLCSATQLTTPFLAWDQTAVIWALPPPGPIYFAAATGCTIPRPLSFWSGQW
ncbi:MAG: FAD-dependent oxidoreductase [Chloroflexi bacterium]|nr:FAD-dependent oxidoreductase [Chloroflexota bacterium]